MLELLTSKQFKTSFITSGEAREFVFSILRYFEQNLVPFLIEMNVSQARDNIKLLDCIVKLITNCIKLCMLSKAEKMIIFIRKRIFTKIFIKKFLKIFRVVESENAFNDSSISFVRYSLDILAGHPEIDTFVEIIAFIFDSLLVVNNTDNFIGSSRFDKLLKMTHSLLLKNKYVLSGKH